MYIDKENLLSDAQAVTASAASTNVIDLGADRDIGPTNLRVRGSVDTAATASGAATVQLILETSNDEDFSSATTLLQTGAIAKADLTEGAVILDSTIPLGTQRYIRGRYVVATGPLTAGKFDLAMVVNSEARRDYPNAI